MLKIHLFGTGEAKYLDRHLRGFPNHKASMLLCYLLLNRKYPQDREKLAALFWGDFSSSVARRNLRHALWELRKILQSTGAPPDCYLTSKEDQIAFVDSSNYWLDIEIFESAIQSGSFLPSTEVNDEYAARLEQAVDLYTGDLLENNYEDWPLFERERLRSLYLKALFQLSRFHAKRGDYERGLHYGKRLLSKEPTSESAHRQVICLYWLAGDRTSALAQYHRCRQILIEELSVSPMDETQQIYERMTRGQFDDVSRWMEANLNLAFRYEKAKKRLQTSENLLKKLHELQRAIEESRTELYQLEQLIKRSFTISH